MGTFYHRGGLDFLLVLLMCVGEDFPFAPQKKNVFLPIFRVVDVEVCAFPSCMRPPPLLPTASVAAGFSGSGEGVAWGLRQKLSVTR